MSDAHMQNRKVRLKLSDIIDIGSLKQLLDQFFLITQIPVGMLDENFNLIFPWKQNPLCDKYHREHQKCDAKCKGFDEDIKQKLKNGQCLEMECPNRLNNIAQPVIIDNHHIATLLLGHFLYEETAFDIDFYKKNAQEYGFDEKEYMEAIQKIPRYNKEKIQQIFKFFTELSGIIVQMGKTNLKLRDEVEKRKQAEHNLQQEQEQYHDLLENTSDIIWSVDKHLNLIYANKSFEKLFGFSPTKKNKIHISEFLTGKCYKNLTKKLAEYKKEISSGKKINGPIQEKICGINKKGEEIWLDLRGDFLLDQNNAFNGIQGISKDITEQLEAEEKSMFSEERLKNILDAIPIPVFYKNKNGTYTGCNQAYANFEGIVHGNIVGKTSHDLFSRKNADYYSLIDQQVLDKKVPVTIERSFAIPGQGKRHAFISKSVFYNPLAKDNEILGLILDVTELKETQQALKQSEEKFRSFVNQSYEGIILIDSNGIILEWNEAIKNLTGIDDEFAIGKSALEVFKELDPLQKNRKKSQFQHILKKLIDGKGENYLNKLLETQIKSIDGNTFDIQQLIFPVELHDMTLFGAVTLDITKRKEVERQLKQSEEFFRKVIENTTDMISVTDNQGTFIYVSPSHERLLGYQKEEMINKKIFDFLCEDEKEKIRTKFFSNTKRFGSYRGEYKMKRKDGSVLWVESTGRNMDAVNSSATSGFIFSRRDISERKNYERNLHFLSNSGLTFLSLTSKDNIFKFIGKQLGHHLPQHEIIVTSFQSDIEKKLKIEYISQKIDTSDTWMQWINRKSLQGYRFSFQEEGFNFLNGKLNQFETNEEDLFPSIPEGLLKQAFNNIPKKPVYYIGLSIENHLFGCIFIIPGKQSSTPDRKTMETFAYQAAIALYRKQIEQRLEIERNNAQKADKLKSAFLANMSHEIRTPMNGILGFTQLLLRSEQNAEKRNRFLQIVYNNSRQLLNIINDIIDISKIEAGQLKLNHTKFELNKLIRETFELFKEKYHKEKENSLKFEFSLGLTDNEAAIIGDGNRINQILVNLLGNSFKFTQDGTIRFGYRYLKNKELLEFFVSDTGIGISDEVRKSIFERFKQGDDTITRKYGGTGLGLSISKQLVELMQGKIWLNSTPQQGTTFYFTIPYKPIRKVEAPKKSEKDRELFNWKKKTVLIVEDDYPSYLFLQSAIEKTGIEILWVQSGKAAIDALKHKTDIDIILMDIQLPGMSGYEATKKIRSFNSTIPVIAQTANAMEGDKAKAIKSGCNSYISKPIDVNELLQKMNTAFSEQLKK